MSPTTPGGWPYVTDTDEPRNYPAVSLDLATKLEAHGPHGGGGVTDHGALTGLADDDHPQYLLPTRVLAGDNVTVDTTTTPGSAIVAATVAQGPPGPPGGAYLSAQWTFNQTVTPPPVSGGLRMNATTFAAATLLYISETDRDGLDRNAGLNVAVVGDQVMIQSAQGRAVFNVTSTTDSGTYRTIGVTLAESSGARPSASAITTVYVITPGTAFATDAEVTAAIAAHAAAADPHTGYLKPTEVLAGTSITVDTATTPGSVIINGAGGAAGSTILSGTDTPTGAIGNVGDYYLDTDDRTLYGPKVLGGTSFGPPQTVFTVHTPSSTLTHLVEWGNRVQVGASGRVTGVRYYRPAGATLTTHSLRLWSDAGALLGTATTSGETGTGWMTATFTTPIAVAGAQVVVASIGTAGAADPMAMYSSGAGSDVVNGDLTQIGYSRYAWATPGSFPTTPDTVKILVDLVFEKQTAVVDPWPVALESVPPGGTTGQVLNKTSNTDYATGWGDPTPGRNRVINGGMAVNQRGFTSTTSAGYGFDRWASNVSGGTVTYSSQTPALGDLPESARTFARLVSAGQSAATDVAAIYQRIESVRSLSAKTATVSFWAKSAAGTPKVSIHLTQGFGTGGSPSAQVQTHAGQITVATSWAHYSVTVAVPSIAGKTLGTAGDDSLTVNLVTSAGSTHNAQTGSLGIQAATIDFWGVQLEEGAAATPFEQKTYADELRACQRYFYQLNASDSTSGITVLSGAGMVTAATTALFAFTHPVKMRIQPALSAVGGASLLITDGISTLSANPTVSATAYNSPSLSWIQGSGSGLTVHWPVALATSAGGPSIAFNAEL